MSEILKQNTELGVVTDIPDSGVEKLDAVRSCIDSGRDLMTATSGTLQSAEGALNSVNSCLGSLQGVIESVGSSLVAWKEIDKEMMAMDIHFAQFSKELDINLDKYKTRIPLIEKQLDAINANLSKMLDFVLSMEAKSEQELDFKMKMMDRIDGFLNTISSTMMNLL